MSHSHDADLRCSTSARSRDNNSAERPKYVKAVSVVCMATENVTDH
jgi:hypothetical protein